ncbi:MAG: DUF3500 domain-containing protein [Bacteroidales bacterium]
MLHRNSLHFVLFLIVFVIQLGCSPNTGKSETVVSNTPRIQPSPPIPVWHAGSPEERAYLNDTFVGITTNGQAEEGVFSIQSTGVSTQPIQDAVNAFLSSLNNAQKEKCTFPVEDDEWRKWHNIDLYEREGIALFELDGQQLKLAFDILEAGLSVDGVTKSKNIMAMEAYLKEISTQLGHLDKEGLARLGDDKYWFTFMGTPSASEPWGWQLDGHHLVINYFVLGDQVVMTPTFMGSELTSIEDGPNAGIRTFEDEGKRGLSLYRSLDQDQKLLATLLEDKKTSYTQAEAFRDNALVTYSGVPVLEFNDLQKQLLMDLIGEYVGNMDEGHAGIKMEEVLSQLDFTWFSWIGGSGDDDVFYYRIQSPVIMIEYEHHSPVFVLREGESDEDPVNWHVHTVVRTPNGNDYGKDLLRQHLEEHHQDGH